MLPAHGILQRSGAAAQPADVVLVCFDELQKNVLETARELCAALV
jgi:hypothetical protein